MVFSTRESARTDVDHGDPGQLGGCTGAGSKKVSLSAMGGTAAITIAQALLLLGYQQAALPADCGYHGTSSHSLEVS
jgi:hypothetical protein